MARVRLQAPKKANSGKTLESVAAARHTKKKSKKNTKQKHVTNDEINRKLKVDTQIAGVVMMDPHEPEIPDDAGGTAQDLGIHPIRWLRALGVNPVDQVEYFDVGWLHGRPGYEPLSSLQTGQAGCVSNLVIDWARALMLVDPTRKIKLNGARRPVLAQKTIKVVSRPNIQRGSLPRPNSVGDDDVPGATDAPNETGVTRIAVDSAVAAGSQVGIGAVSNGDVLIHELVGQLGGSLYYCENAMCGALAILNARALFLGPGVPAMKDQFYENYMKHFNHDRPCVQECVAAFHQCGEKLVQFRKSDHQELLSDTSRPAVYVVCGLTHTVVVDSTRKIVCDSDCHRARFFPYSGKETMCSVLVQRKVLDPITLMDLKKLDGGVLKVYVSYAAAISKDRRRQLDAVFGIENLAIPRLH